MHKYMFYIFNAINLMLILVSNPVYARNVPDELLNIPITLISGEKVTLSDFNGKSPVYLKFWATWCQPCRSEMPHLEQIHKKYGDQVKVISINIDVSDSIEAVKSSIDEFGLSMPIAIDSSGELTQAFKMVGTPYHLLFDKNMNLIHRGHEANKSLDNKLSLVSQTKPVDLLGSRELVSENNVSDNKLEIENNTTYALFFTSTWCDWYLKDSRPETSKNCIAAQKYINELHSEYPDINWTGVVSRLWAGKKELSDYTRKYSIKYPQFIDNSNNVFYDYKVKDLPTLIVIKDKKVVSKFVDFSNKQSISAAFNRL